MPLSRQAPAIKEGKLPRLVSLMNARAGQQIWLRNIIKNMKRKAEPPDETLFCKTERNLKLTNLSPMPDFHVRLGLTL